MLAPRLQLQELIRTVLPFDALMFKSHRAVAPSSRRGLEVLEDCARQLLQYQTTCPTCRALFTVNAYKATPDK